MGDLALAHGADLMKEQSFNGDGLPIEGYEFHLKTFSILMRHNDCSNITDFQSKFCDVFGKNYFVKFVYRHVKKEISPRKPFLAAHG
jgi:hypothetical protein